MAGYHTFQPRNKTNDTRPSPSQETADQALLLPHPFLPATTAHMEGASTSQQETAAVGGLISGWGLSRSPCNTLVQGHTSQRQCRYFQRRTCCREPAAAVDPLWPAGLLTLGSRLLPEAVALEELGYELQQTQQQQTPANSTQESVTCLHIQQKHGCTAPFPRLWFSLNLYALMCP